MENELTISLPSAEDKVSFMQWFRKEGFDSFLSSKRNKTGISCLSTFEVGTTGKERTYDCIENGWIELE